MKGGQRDAPHGHQSARARNGRPAGSARSRRRIVPCGIAFISPLRKTFRRSAPLSSHRMGICRGFVGRVGRLALALLAARVAGAQASPVVRPLEFTRTVLQNGLVVVLNEDHSAPIVAVDVWYHIGAKDEQPGRTGLAHLCEHLMGEGSPNLATPQRIFIQSLGGTSSRWANTTEDITHFY